MPVALNDDVVRMITNALGIREVVYGSVHMDVSHNQASKITLTKYLTKEDWVKIAKELEKMQDA